MATTVESIVEQISKMTAIELSELKTALEEKFGVTVAAPMMGMPMMGAAPEVAAEEEKTSFDVILTSAGEKKFDVIKVVREQGHGLREAKDLVDSAPKPIKEGVSKDEAEKLKAALEAAGAKVELK